MAHELRLKFEKCCNEVREGDIYIRMIFIDIRIAIKNTFINVFLNLLKIDG